MQRNCTYVNNFECHSCVGLREPVKLSLDVEDRYIDYFSTIEVVKVLRVP